MNWLAIIAVVIGVPGMIFAIIRIVSHFKNKRTEKEQKQNSKEIDIITADEIISNFKASGNSYQYENYKVKWNAAFNRIDMVLFGKSQLFFDIIGGTIKTEVRISDYPALKNEKTGANYKIIGIIEKVDSKSIQLKLTELRPDRFFVV